jgi:hypothetical protein
MNTEITSIVADYLANQAEYSRLDALPLTPDINVQLNALAANGWLLRDCLSRMEATTLAEYQALATVCLNDRGRKPTRSRQYSGIYSKPPSLAGEPPNPDQGGSPPHRKPLS